MPFGHLNQLESAAFWDIVEPTSQEKYESPTHLWTAKVAPHTAIGKHGNPAGNHGSRESCPLFPSYTFHSRYTLRDHLKIFTQCHTTGAVPCRCRPFCCDGTWGGGQQWRGICYRWHTYIHIYIYTYTAWMGVLPGESPPEVYFNCAEAVFLCILGCRAGWPTGWRDLFPKQHPNPEA